MKRRTLVAAAGILAIAGSIPLSALAAEKTIVVGVTAGPHAEIMEVVKRIAEKQGMKIRIVEFNDFVQPNAALVAGDLDINSFQHKPYMDQQSEDRGYKLASAAPTITFPLTYYTRKGYKTLVDWEKAGVNRVEAVIELNVSPKKSRGFDEIAATIAAFDEVESVLLMSGGYDLQLVIKGQTFQEIALFVAKRLSPLDDVLSTATHFVLRTYKKEGRLYQDEEIDERECTVL